MVGHTIGVGIFLTPAELIGAVASPGLTLGLWVVCGALYFIRMFFITGAYHRYFSHRSYKM